MNSLDLIEQVLRENQIPYLRPTADRILTGSGGRHTEVEISILAQDPLVSLVARSLASVRPSRRDEAVRLANLLNATCLRWGAFWISPDNHLAFELAVIAPADGLQAEQFAAGFQTLVTLDQYFPAFAAVLWGEASAEAALELLLKDARAGSDVEADQDRAALESDEEGEGPTFEVAV